MNQKVTRHTTSQQTISRLLPSQPVTSATVVGLGNIGAELVALLARQRKLDRVTLVDFDHYEPENIRAQNIVPGDVGKPKVQVQARKMRHIAPNLQVCAIRARFEELSLNQIRSDLLVSCLDSRIARTHLNEASFRLGVPLLDGAVQGRDLQARVAVYLPGPESPCLECQFADADYAVIEQVASCIGPSQATPTNAPAALGAIVAGMQAIEIQKMIEGRWDQVLIDRQVFFDLRHHKHYVTRFCRNPNCRFDHDVWSIAPLPKANQPTKLTDLFDTLRATATDEDRGDRSLRLRVRGQPFVRRLTCPTCRKMQSVLMLERRWAAACSKCEDCGGTMVVSVFDKSEWLDQATLRPQDLKRGLRSLGFRRGDVLTIGDGNVDRHFELDGIRNPANSHVTAQQV
jgi:molybdopterin/thiamine biosynthesis adenylyltransferase